MGNPAYTSNKNQSLRVPEEASSHDSGGKYLAPPSENSAISANRYFARDTRRGYRPLMRLNNPSLAVAQLEAGSSSGGEVASASGKSAASGRRTAYLDRNEVEA